MKPEEIQTEWDAFIDYPEGSGKLYVTTTSALIFVRSIVEMAEKRERDRLRTQNQALREALKDTAQTLEWMRHGKCRGFSDGLLTTQEALDKAREALTAAQQAQPFQSRVAPWMLECFGQEIADNAEERNHRFLEEALELVQACGCTQGEANQLVDYVFGRPAGEKGQEVGGVMVTLAALCLAQRLCMHACGEIELARIWTKVESIRAKQAAKPKHSPLPEHPAKQAQPERAPLSCTWTQEDDFDMPGVYHTSCGEMWSFTEGGIKENNTKFCPHCGGGIKQGGQHD